MLSWVAKRTNMSCKPNVKCLPNNVSSFGQVLIPYIKYMISSSVAQLKRLMTVTFFQCMCVCVGGGGVMLIVADEKLSASFLFLGNFRGIHLFRQTLAPKSNRALDHNQGLLTRFPEILRVIYVLLNRYVIFSALQTGSRHLTTM